MPNRLRSWWGTTIGSGPITREHPPLALLWLGLIALGPLLWNLSVTGPTTLGPGLDGELYYVTYFGNEYVLLGYPKLLRQLLMLV